MKYGTLPGSDETTWYIRGNGDPEAGIQVGCEVNGDATTTSLTHSESGVSAVWSAT